MRHITAIFLGFFTILLVSCAPVGPDGQPRIEDHMDRKLGRSYNDYENQILNKKTLPQQPHEIIPYPAARGNVPPVPSALEDAIAAKKKAASFVPDFSSILATPLPPQIGSDKLVSLSVTEDVPLKQVLIELSRLAGVDMEVDPGITGGIILNVHDKPFHQVVARVAKLGGLRFKDDNGVVRVERDMPFQKEYNVDFLNIIRSNEGRVVVNTQVIGGEDSNDITTGSSMELSSNYEGDLWSSVQATIESIIRSDTFNSTATENQNSSRRNSGEERLEKFISVNKQAGVISVLANSRQHARVQEYIEKIGKSVSSQVLIEAKIVEVSLNDEYRTGIDWGELSDSNLGLSVTGNFDAGIDSAANFFRITGTRSINSALTMLDRFGTARALSSPRVHAMNNQQAVLTFAENEVYFTVSVEEETDDTDVGENRTLTVESEVHTVPVGVILTLQPSINMDTQEVTMNIRPTLSRITERRSDPAVDLVLARSGLSDSGISSEIPVIEVRELDSILKIKSGEVMVIGGLMTDTNNNTDTGVPYASRVPVLGNLFKSVVKTNEVVETIIFIRATITSNQGVGQPDQNLYNSFTRDRDPRPLAF